MGDFDHYLSCTRTWKDLLFYPDGTFNHKRYESIDTNVDKKVTRLLQEYRSILSPEQYCLFGSLLLGWEIIDDIVVLEDDGGRASISSVNGLGRRECDRILSEYEWRIYDDFYDDSRSHCFFERIAEIILM